MELWKEELYHFGIQGMHWGIRRFQPYPKGHTGGKEVGEAAKKKRKRGEVTIQPVKPVAKATAAKNSTQQTTESPAQTAPKVTTTETNNTTTTTTVTTPQYRPSGRRTIYELSDDELKARINRLELEKKYKALYLEAQPKKEVSNGEKFVKDILSSSGKNIATQWTTYMLGTAVNKLMGTDVVNPKKGQKDK